MTRKDLCLDRKTPKCLRPSLSNNLPARALDPEQYNLLSLHAQYWDLNRTIFLDKLIPIEGLYTTIMDLAYNHYEEREFLPPRMVQAGIRQLHHAEVFMWTPLCVILSLQSKNRALFEASPMGFLVEEIRSLQDMKLRHQRVVVRGV